MPKVNEVIREELSKLIQERFASERALITVTQCEVARDLKRAKVGLSIVPLQKRERTELVRQIQNHAHEMQRLLVKNIRMKYIPNLIFYLDTGVERLQRIDEVITKIHKKG